MTSSAIIKRARSLADIPNSLFITYEDESNSLFEAWKDTYNLITNSSDDYFVKELILDTSTAVNLGQNEWEIPMPAGSDVWKLRFVNYLDSGRWVAMSKFNTAMRNSNGGRPMYRWRGDALWVTGGAIPGQIRIDYYPSPVKPSLPEVAYPYALSYPRYELSKLSTPAFYAERNANNANITDYQMIVYNGTILRLESYTMKSNVILYTGATAITNVRYNVGYVYFLMGGDIYRAPTTNGGTLVPVAITATANLVSFSIQNNTIYYASATGTYSMALDGTGSTQLYASVYTDYSLIGTDVYWVASGTIWKNSVDTAISATQLRSDGEFLYYISGGVVYKTPDMVASEVLLEGITYIGQPLYGFIPTISLQYEVNAQSTMLDFEFIYPLNESNEIMAYRCAIDFRRKQEGDLNPLMVRLAEITTRLLNILARDSYQPERRIAEALASGYSSMYY